MLPIDFATPADMALCRQMIRQGSKSFHLASLLLPSRYREQSRCLYGFCRMADDLVDNAQAPREAVEQLAERLDLIYAGTPGDAPTDRAFADVVHRFGIPRSVPEALIEGFLWDAEGRHYKTLGDATAYAVRVAGTVGVMMSLIMNVRGADALSRAIDLGVAMQFSNIARDIIEDAGNGRVYLPDEWLTEAGMTRGDVLHDPKRAASVATRLVAEAELFYEQAKSGIAQLPARCRSSINAARLLYREIGVAAAQLNHAKRAVVPLSRKIPLLAKSVVQTPFLFKDKPAPCLSEGQFLLDAVAETSVPPHPFKGIDGQIGWVMEMLKTVEARKS
jgi:15-cis-phytoene synthase